MSERPDEPLVEVEVGRISRPTTARFFFRSDEDPSDVAQAPPEPEDWRALRLREILAQRAERLHDRPESTFRLPWNELLRAVVQVIEETGSDVDRAAETVVDVPAEDADFDPEGSTRFAAESTTRIQDPPPQIKLQQDLAYAERKLRESEEERQELGRRLAAAEEQRENLRAQLAELSRLESAARRAQERASGELEQAQQAQADVHQDLERSRAQLAQLQETVDRFEADRDAALLETATLNGALDQARRDLRQIRAGQEGLQEQLEAYREDGAILRRQFNGIRRRLEDQIAELEEELLRRSAGHEHEREALRAELSRGERVLRELFDYLPEEELRGWVPGLEREPWCEETAIRHLHAMLELLERYQRERRQARLVVVPDFAALLERVARGRGLVAASQQPLLARLARELERGEQLFEALREVHLSGDASLGQLIELQAVVARTLACERELTALGV